MAQFWQFPHQRVFRGQILVEGGHGAQCDVHNATQTGAMVQLASAAQMPSAFELAVECAPKFGSKHGYKPQV